MDIHKAHKILARACAVRLQQLAPTANIARAMSRPDKQMAGALREYEDIKMALETVTKLVNYAETPK